MKSGLYPNLEGRLRVLATETHRTIHHLWTQAVDAPGYDKAQWTKLDLLMDELVSLAASAPVSLSGDV